MSGRLQRLPETNARFYYRRLDGHDCAHFNIAITSNISCLRSHELTGREASGSPQPRLLPEGPHRLAWPCSWNLEACHEASESPQTLHLLLEGPHWPAWAYSLNPEACREALWEPRPHQLPEGPQRHACACSETCHEPLGSQQLLLKAPASVQQSRRFTFHPAAPQTIHSV